jgi:hypothetical protein
MWRVCPWRLTVKRRSRINFSFAPQRIERLKVTPEFQDIAASNEPPGRERDKEVRYGKRVQDDIVLLLGDMDGSRVYDDRDEFRRLLESAFKGLMKLPPYFWDVMMDALSEEE